jgi:hypothetical protein
VQTLPIPRGALWVVYADTEAYFGLADFLAQLLEINILLRNTRFRTSQRVFGWRQLWTLHNDLRFEAQGDKEHSGEKYVKWSN